MNCLSPAHAARERIGERIGEREMARGLEKVLEQKYDRILRAAGNEWERRFAGREPSDACVSIRISSWSRAPSETALQHSHVA